MIGSILIMMFFNLMVAASLFNTFKDINRDLMYLSSALRLIYLGFFVISIILLFVEQPIFTQVFLISHFLYAFHLILLGYLSGCSLHFRIYIINPKEFFVPADKGNWPDANFFVILCTFWKPRMVVVFRVFREVFFGFFFFFFYWFIAPWAVFR